MIDRTALATFSLWLGLGSAPRALARHSVECGRLEWRFAGGELEKLANLAAELVKLKVDIIVAGATPVISAAQKSTTAIPIVMAPVNDPVGSLGRPGGNITGLSNLSTDLSPKIIELLHSITYLAHRYPLESRESLDPGDRQQSASGNGASRSDPHCRGGDRCAKHRACVRQNKRTACGSIGCGTRYAIRRGAPADCGAGA